MRDRDRYREGSRSRDGERSDRSDRSGRSSRDGGGDRSGRGRRKKKKKKKKSAVRRAVLWSLLGVFILLIVTGLLVTLAYVQTFHVYKTLKQITPELASARRQLAQAQVPANDEISKASGLAAQAQDQIDGAGFPFRFTRALPFFSRPIHAIELATGAADEESQAAQIVQDLVTKMLGTGGDDSAPPVFNNGVIDVELLQSIGPSLQSLVGHLQSAQADLNAIPTIPFVSKVDDVKVSALDETSAALALAQRAMSGAQLLPSFLGADGPRNYFLALQNNADERGTGGAVLAYALMHIDAGKITLIRAGPIIDIDRKKGGFSSQLSPALLWYAKAAGVPHRIANINYSPDFPSAAETWVPMIKESTGLQMNGVIALDPFAVAAVLEHEAPIRVRSLGLEINNKDVVPFTEHDQYTLPIDQQKVIPGLLIQEAYTAITSPKHFIPLIRTMANTLADKHIQIWSSDKAQQGLITQLGWDGAISNPGGDYLNLAYEKRIVGKQDYFLHQHVEYDVTVNASGGISSTYKLTATSAMPADEPLPVAGPASPYGVTVGMWNLYVPKGAQFDSVTPSADLPTDVVTPDTFTKFVQPKKFMQHVEGNFRVFTKMGLAWPGSPYALTYHYTVPKVITTAADGSKVYTLTVQNQPFANPMSTTINVTLPKGATVASIQPTATPSPAASVGGSSPAPAPSPSPTTVYKFTQKGNVVTLTVPAVTRDFTISIAFTA